MAQANVDTNMAPPGGHKKRSLEEIAREAEASAAVSKRLKLLKDRPHCYSNEIFEVCHNIIQI